MRVYVNTSAAVALELLEHGFRDIHTVSGQAGVWCDGRPRGGFRPAAGHGVMVGGPLGNTVLCTDVPEDVFREAEFQESTRSLTPEETARAEAGGPDPDDLEYQRMGYAVIPAEVLNRYGKPRLYDHDYAGCSRAELVRDIQTWGRDPDPASQKTAQEMRDAMAFFDRVGWLAPLRLHEPDGRPDDLPPLFRVEGEGPPE
jgi:hypothetical protein